MTCRARKLPIELLAEIVQFASVDNARAPLHVSQVCSEWRAVINLPILWNALDLSSPERIPQSLEQARLWISRAGDLPLHIKLHLEHRSPALELTARFLAQYAQRLQTLSIYVPVFDLISHILTSLRTTYPNLKTLFLIATNSWIDNDNPADAGDHLDLLSEMGELPSLRKLHVENTSFSVIGFPSGLTSISLELAIFSSNNDSIRGTFTSLISSLTQLQSLHQLTIDTTQGPEAPNDFHWEPDQSQIVNLPLLETLSLRSRLDYIDLIRHLRTPALRKLNIYSSLDSSERALPTGASMWHSGDLTLDFLTRSNSVFMETISLYEIDVRPSSYFFPKVFKLSPQLRELRLHDVMINDADLMTLQGPSSLCPALERIDLRWCSNVGEGLLALITSRLRWNKEFGCVTPLSSIGEVSAINCLQVKDEYIAALAEITLCRVRTKADDDFCLDKRCCQNDKYRQRLRLHFQDKQVKITSASRSRGLIW
jgi:hypothetical protein